MNIAYDAKRAFHNNTGLGQYSRNLLYSFFTNYPEHRYFLMTPKTGDLFDTSKLDHVEIVEPSGYYKLLSSFWRSKGVVGDLKKLDIQLYHGLSHEIPIGLSKTRIRSVVTIHDLIFERYPKQYKAVDVAMYRKKFRYACEHSDVVIAISEQTKRDLIDFYKVPEKKIEVCYQSCNKEFQNVLTEQQLADVKMRYNLPDEYILYVGSVIERKNLLTICKSLYELKDRIDIPLVVIGSGGEYLRKVKEYINANGLASRVMFISETSEMLDDPNKRKPIDMPGIYQQAAALIYPSMFEGFGIPVLEALWSEVPVITSNLSCLPETGGEAAYYIDPMNIEEMTSGLEKVLTDSKLRDAMVTKGKEHAKNFTPELCASKVMNVYRTLV